MDIASTIFLMALSMTFSGFCLSIGFTLGKALIDYIKIWFAMKTETVINFVKSRNK